MTFLNAKVAAAIESFGISTLKQLRTLPSHELWRLADKGSVSTSLVKEAAQVAATAELLGAVRYALLLQAAGTPDPADLDNVKQAVKALKEANGSDDGGICVAGTYLSPSLIDEGLVTKWKNGERPPWSPPKLANDRNDAAQESGESVCSASATSSSTTSRTAPPS